MITSCPFIFIVVWVRNLELTYSSKMLPLDDETLLFYFMHAYLLARAHSYVSINKSFHM
jgi:hypothetical protein